MRVYTRIETKLRGEGGVAAALEKYVIMSIVHYDANKERERLYL